MLKRIWKAARARSKKLRGRSAWQDALPPTTEGRDAYEIAARHESNFGKVWITAMRGLLTTESERAFVSAWNKRDRRGMVASIPSPEHDRKFREHLHAGYAAVIQDAGDEATAELNRDFKTDMAFTLIAKAAKPTVPTVPVNPYSIAWIREHTLLFTQNLVKQQRETVRTLVLDGFSRGLRAEEAYADIKENIALTDREAHAVINRRILHEEAGMNASEVKRLTKKYRNKLLIGRARRIGRTETMDAQARGRRDAWKLADDSGQLPEVEREWLTPAATACDICADLNGKRAPINGTYESIEGPLDGPTAHPNCRCTEALVRAGSK